MTEEFIRRVLGFGPAMAIAMLWLSTASAGTLTKAWVSSAGADGPSCGPIATPCRTLNGALANVASGAEIDVKDAGAFGPGPVTIRQAVSIVNDGVGTAGVQAAQFANGFTIAAGVNDTVSIRGFTIDASPGAFQGIEFDSGGALTVTNCVVRGFSNGIWVTTTSGQSTLLISNVFAYENSSAGITFNPSSGSAGLNAIIDHVVTNNNGLGIGFNSASSSGPFNLTISNSTISANVYGIFVQNNSAARAIVTIDTDEVTDNTYGVDVSNTVVAMLTNVTITSNETGIIANSTTASYGNNRVDWNTNNVSGSLVSYFAR